MYGKRFIPATRMFAWYALSWNYAHITVQKSRLITANSKDKEPFRSREGRSNRSRDSHRETRSDR